MIAHGGKWSAEKQAQREGCVWRWQGADQTMWGLRETVKVSNAVESICSYVVELGWPQKVLEAGGFAAPDLASREDRKVEVSC